MEIGGFSGLGEAAELGLVGVAEAALGAGGEERRGKEGEKIKEICETISTVLYSSNISSNIYCIIDKGTYLFHTVCHKDLGQMHF